MPNSKNLSSSIQAILAKRNARTPGSAMETAEVVALSGASEYEFDAALADLTSFEIVGVVTGRLYLRQRVHELS